MQAARVRNFPVAVLTDRRAMAAAVARARVASPVRARLHVPLASAWMAFVARMPATANACRVTRPISQASVLAMLRQRSGKRMWPRPSLLSLDLQWRRRLRLSAMGTPCGSIQVCDGAGLCIDPMLPMTARGRGGFAGAAAGGTSGRGGASGSGGTITGGATAFAAQSRRRNCVRWYNHRRRGRAAVQVVCSRAALVDEWRERCRRQRRRRHTMIGEQVFRWHGFGRGGWRERWSQQRRRWRQWRRPDGGRPDGNRDLPAPDSASADGKGNSLSPDAGTTARLGQSAATVIWARAPQARPGCPLPCWVPFSCCNDCAGGARAMP